MSNMCIVKIKASLLLSPISIFSNTSRVHPSSFQPLSWSFIHPPSHVPISSNIHVRHVTKVHAAGEGQLHHSSLLVGCQSSIKPTSKVCWKSERFGWKHRTFIMGHLSLYHQEYQYFPLSSVGNGTNSGCGCLSHYLHGVIIFQVMHVFFYQSDFIAELSILSGRQACSHFTRQL